MIDPTRHLSPDDLDAATDSGLAPAAAAHAELCTTCQQLLDADREVVRLLEAAPQLHPSAQFADQVMTQIALPDPFSLRAVDRVRDKIMANRRSFAWVASMAAVVVAAMGLSIVWTMANQDALATMGAGMASQATTWFWSALQGVASNFIEQSWFENARGVFGTPSRLALYSGLVSLLYLVGVLALKRLMALPTERVAHAQL